MFSVARRCSAPRKCWCGAGRSLDRMMEVVPLRGIPSCFSIIITFFLPCPWPCTVRFRGIGLYDQKSGHSGASDVEAEMWIYQSTNTRQTSRIFGHGVSLYRGCSFALACIRQGRVGLESWIGQRTARFLVGPMSSVPPSKQTQFALVVQENLQVLMYGELLYLWLSDLLYKYYIGLKRRWG